MLAKRTYIVPVLVLAVAFPAAAHAQRPGGHAQKPSGPAPRIGLADARPAAAWSVMQPVRRFHRAIRLSVRRIRTARRAKRREMFASLPAGVSMATLESIALCESGGDPTIVSADGSFRGKYQFTYGTWASVGGSGDPAVAPEAEQDYRAALLYASAGSSPWPVCGS